MTLLYMSLKILLIIVVYLNWLTITKIFPDYTL